MTFIIITASAVSQLNVSYALNIIPSKELTKIATKPIIM
jgi:hypothetical protein